MLKRFKLKKLFKQTGFPLPRNKFHRFFKRVLKQKHFNQNEKKKTFAEKYPISIVI